jgi:outer membrane protein OmpA-like peptidoglycan-associated protein
MIRSHLVLVAAGFAGLLGCSATVTPPVVAVPAPPPVAAPVVEAPAPPPPAAPKLTAVCDAEIGKWGQLKFPREVEFETGKAVLKLSPNSTAILQCLNDFLTNNKMVTKFKIGGHTDNAGDPAANEALSLHRAEAVIAYMTAHGADAGRLMAEGYGSKRPVDPKANNDLPENREKNRRVEFYVQEVNGVQANPQVIAAALNPPAPAAAPAPAVAAAPAVGVAVAVPGVAVAAPSVAVTAPTVGVTAPTSVSVGVSTGTPAPKKK